MERQRDKGEDRRWKYLATVRPKTRQWDGDSDRHGEFWVPDGCWVGASYGGLVTAVSPAYRISEPGPFKHIRLWWRMEGPLFCRVCVQMENTELLKLMSLDLCQGMKTGTLHPKVPANKKSILARLMGGREGGGEGDKLHHLKSRL